MEWFGALQSNLKPFQASKVLGKCLNLQGIPKNVMLGTKNIIIGQLGGPELAHIKVTVGLHISTKTSKHCPVVFNKIEI